MNAIIIHCTHVLIKNFKRCFVMIFEDEIIQVSMTMIISLAVKATSVSSQQVLPPARGTILTRLSNIRMRASNSCSPICHLGGDPLPSPTGGPGKRDLALYFPGSSKTKLSGPPELARVRTFSKTRKHNDLSSTERCGASDGWGHLAGKLGLNRKQVTASRESKHGHTGTALSRRPFSELFPWHIK